MKKLLLVLAIGAFVACNDNGGSDDTTTDTLAPSTADTTAIPVDTTVVKPADTTVRK